MITTADDALHPPGSDDFWWSETYYFNFDAPEAGLSCIVYPWLRANLGVATCGVAVWQGFATSPFQMRLYDWQQQLPMPEGGLPDVAFANGVTIECLQPLLVYRLRYNSPPSMRQKTSFDVTWEGIAPPYEVLAQDLRFLGKGHYDQLGHAKGWLQIDEERYVVDSYVGRDRSWGPRPDLGDQMGYATTTLGVASPDVGWHILCAGSSEHEYACIGGVMLVDGQVGRLVTAAREVLRRHDSGRPEVVRVTGVDEAGRTLDVTGEAVNGAPFHARPNLFSWVTAMHWEGSWDGRDTSFYGQDQDAWSFSLYRDRVRQGRFAMGTSEPTTMSLPIGNAPTQ